ncbi:MATE family efflux transporter [Peptostreptococcus porci]|uniref:MATE family efflux transporter n=2 Tax=Peptostreptococcus porci TaxID=2652282 RepID=UPI0023F0A645|nr:MATE family efflux transporter [Peptostreptococcus porci]MDD7182954.1 MATE family efflux transporter [Peptostreptococcus porci]MDY6232572.1 MATE family efflux transporter [Peptostreptococcus porci]
MNTDLGSEKITKLIFMQSGPAIMSMVVAAIYNVVDRIFVGRIEPLALTAVGITMPFQYVQMAFVLLIGIGGSTLISIKYGEKDIDSAESILYNSLIFIIVAELFITVLGIFFIDPIFRLLGVSQSVDKMAREYIVIILLGGIPGLTGYCLNNSVRSTGFSKYSMKYVTISSVTNIILDAIFILVFGWGVKGAAFATVISQTLVTLYVINFFVKNESVPIKLKLGTSKISKDSIKKIVSNGAPSFYMNISGVILGVILNRFIIRFGGDYNMASITIVSSISMLFTMIFYGISQGAQPIIGYNLGAKRIDRSIEAVKVAAITITIFSVIFLAFIELFPNLLVSMFTSDKELVKLTNHNIKIFLLGLPMIGLHSISTTYFQSISRVKTTSILYVLRYGGILLPLLCIFPNILGIDGVYVSNALSDIISGIIALVFLIMEIRKTSSLSEY